MSDDEDYDSEDDVDYVPQAEDVSEEENSGEEEDLTVLGITGKILSGSRKKKQNKNISLGVRKRQGGIKLDGDGDCCSKSTEKDEGNLKLVAQIEQEKVVKKDVLEKKKADDLWSSFLSDVEVSPKKASPSTTSLTKLTKSQNENPSKQICTEPKKETPNKMVEITKVFDFAGEEVKITQQVAADSKEAKKELKTKVEIVSSSPGKTAGSVLSSIGIKRPAAGGGLGGVLNKIGKKQKISVLEKSKMDWNSFKKEEGIENDLKIHNNSKEGYIDRMKFLQRTDLRQFEIEKNLRLNSKR